MCENLSINAVSYDTFKVLFPKFKIGYFEIEEEPHSGNPIEVNCELLGQIIDQYTNVSTRTIMLELNLCQKTSYSSETHKSNV